MTRALAAVLGGLLLAAAAGCDQTTGRFPIGFERMRDQPRYEPYGRSHVFADGAEMRPLPPNTVAADGPDAAAESVDGTIRGRVATTIPVAIDRAAIAEGRRRYDIFCSPCHGLDGQARTPVALAMALRPPPSLLDPRIRAFAVGDLYRVISRGYGLMPSYARQLRPDTRWDVIAYVRALQLRRGESIAALPADLRAEASRALASHAATQAPGGRR